MSEKKDNQNNLDSQKSEVAKREEAVLQFWQDNKIFAKSLEKEAPNGEFVFYDGPPFATGLPHYGHLLGGTIKDVFPRYETMRGKRVYRRWGWDCHGLPIENIIEKELGLKTKKDIEELGIEKFNETARVAVLQYVDVWKKIVPRMGRWVDMENDYKSMDASYTESIWWSFKELYKKGLLYEGFKSMHICPRCETTLSNFEVNSNYQDITDISVTVKLELKEEPRVYFLAWTTTPWTLPGNVAVAINKNLIYSRVKVESEVYIVATEKVEEVFKDKEYEILESFKGDELIGLSYKPLFEYFKDKPFVNFEKKDIDDSTIWRVYHADYVDLEKGTGLVHLAPAFGEEDMELAKKENLPFIQHVNMSGLFIDQVEDFKGQPVKPKDNHQVADIEIIKNLAHRGLLFSKEKIIHSYPLCWRCDTPLLNYAASSWFVKVTDIKDKLIKANEGIGWTPEHIKEGRFGNWLEGARDWAISRSRFWGAPLPVWKCEDCDEIKIMGSVEELLSHGPEARNSWTLMRHGEASHNLSDTISDQKEDEVTLTESGRQEVEGNIKSFKKNKPVKIVASPFMRTKETAELLAQELSIDSKDIIYDDRLGEIKTGLNGEKWDKYHDFFKGKSDKFYSAPEGGESIPELRTRVMQLIFELEEKYQGEHILIISHGLPLFIINESTKGVTSDELVKRVDWSPTYFATGETRELKFREYPHNQTFELDLHRPYIDKIKLTCKCGKEIERILEIFDCWFESGSMPFAQAHYPFSDNNFYPGKSKGYPADFIAEGLDQTRGWFYSLLVLGVGLFDRAPYKNVIVNGLLLAEDGQKMSKKLKNYPAVDYVIDLYGADALRFYLLSSPAVHGEDIAFKEKNLAEVYRKIILRFKNSYQFFQTYGDRNVVSGIGSNILDQWMAARVGLAKKEVEKHMVNYEVDRATRELDSLIDDLSNWYVRRSRDRFKNKETVDYKEVNQTFVFVFENIAKLMAPFTPFMTEEIFQDIKQDKTVSVHLEDWPTDFAYNENILDEMVKVREVVSLALEKRAKSGIKVRQPLQTLYIKEAISEEYFDLVKDEVNVKEIKIKKDLEVAVELDLGITSELKQEGLMRDVIRQIQSLRKEQGFLPEDEINLSVEVEAAGESIIKDFTDIIKNGVGAEEIIFSDSLTTEPVEIGELNFKFEIKKVG